MGNNKKKYRKNKNKNKNPFVSVCTPTLNRRPFFKYLIKCFENQTYPKDKMEWIIIDDGTDKIEDLVMNIPNVKYFKYDKKLTLGKKRNIMHKESKGDIIVYMDDDDFYPKDRVSHAVNMLKKNKNALCAGSSEIYIYFNHIKKLYQFGPYGDKHATAGTFAFKRELLNITSYNEEACLAEEKEFLKNYTIPFVQLNPLKTILVFSHNQNTFDKKKLLENIPNKYVKESEKTLDHFITDKDIKIFYSETIHELIKDYHEGNIEMKPDVIKQTQEIQKMRENMIEKMNNNFTVKDSITGNEQNVSVQDINNIINNLTNENKLLKLKLNHLIENQKLYIIDNNTGNKTNIHLEQLVKEYNTLRDEHNKTLEENNLLNEKIVNLENKLKT